MKPLEFLYISFIPCKQNSFRPQFFESGIPLFIIAALFLLKFLNFSLLFSLPAASFFPQLTKEEIIELTNQERQQLGLSPLQQNLLLERAAYLKGKDMLARGYFSHTDPEGTPPWHYLQKIGYRYIAAGENLAIGFIDAKEVIDVWNNSPSHRKNIVNPEYKEIGVAVLKGNFNGAKATLVVQLFGTPNTTKMTARNKETEPIKTPEKQAPSFSQPKSLAELKAQEQPSAPKESSVLGTEKYETVTTDVTPDLTEKKSAAVNVVKNLKNKGQVLDKFVYSALFLFMLAFLLMVLVRFEIQHKDLVFRALLFLALILMLIIADREVFLSLIPHRLMI